MKHNHLNEGDKQMVAFPNGAKAILIFRGQYKKMKIDFYQPSSAYFNHIKGKTLKSNTTDQPKKRMNLNRFGTHLHLVNMHLSCIFKSTNPNADDSWLEDTEEQQLIKNAAWNRRRTNEQ